MSKIIASMLVFLSLVQPVLAVEWIYKDPFLNREALRIERHPAYIIYNGHVGLEWYGCGDKVFVCLISKGFVFSYSSEESLSWVVGGVNFNKKLLGDVSILGRLYKGSYSVTSSQEGIRYEFIYSPMNGLIGILAGDASDTRFLISATSCGFGASRDCR